MGIPQPMADSIGLIGDVHAEDQILAGALRALRERGITQILCTGDVVDGRGDANRCCDLLISEGVAAVRGNHDEWCLEGRLRDLPGALSPAELTSPSRAFLSALPATRQVAAPGGDLLLCHGMGDNTMARLAPDDEGYALEANDDLQLVLARSGLRFVVAGHTHRRMVREIEGVLFINPGSLIPDQQCGFLVLSPAEVKVERFTMDDQGEVMESSIMEVMS